MKFVLTLLIALALSATGFGQSLPLGGIPVTTGGGGGSLAIDSQMPSATGAVNAGGSFSYSFTNTAGTVLFVGAVTGFPGCTVSSVTYNSVAMTLVQSQISHDGSTGAQASLWVLLNPATGANDVAVTSSTSCVALSGAISFTGNSATPIAQSSTNHGSSGNSTISLSGTTSGNYVIAVASNGSAISSATYGTLSWLINYDNVDYGNNAAMSYIAAGGTVTLGFTQADDGWAIVAAEIQ